jgi:glycosyltransferase involved in cell wall biosynthesis
MRRTSVAVDVRALVATPTGIGFYTLSMLRALAEIGTFRLIAMAHERPHYAEELEDAGIEIESHPALSGVVWQQTRAPRRLALGDVDLFWSPILTLPLKLTVPAVTTVHDLTPLLHPETHRLKVRLSVLPFLSRSLARADCVVADSESTAEDLRLHYPECAGRIRVIYPGVDPVFEPGEPTAIASTRDELGCAQGYFLYAGTLEPRKNLDFLLDAWEAARRADPQKTLPLLLCGPAGWAPKAFYRRLAALEGQGVRWLGRLPRQRLVGVMQAATWFVYPSLYEGFGLPVVEAMACGVPPIVSRSSSLPEIVDTCGHQIDPADPTGLAALLEVVSRDEARRNEASACALHRARRFDWQSAAAQLASCFEALLADST